MPCSPERYRELQQERLEFLRAYKVKSGCMDCGYRKRPEALDFDHVRGTKLINPSKMSNHIWAWSRIFDELEKCEVVCSNCHRIRSADRLQAASMLGMSRDEGI